MHGIIPLRIIFLLLNDSVSSYYTELLCCYADVCGRKETMMLKYETSLGIVLYNPRYNSENSIKDKEPNLLKK